MANIDIEHLIPESAKQDLVDINELLDKSVENASKLAVVSRSIMIGTGDSKNYKDYTDQVRAATAANKEYSDSVLKLAKAKTEESKERLNNAKAVDVEAKSTLAGAKAKTEEAKERLNNAKAADTESKTKERIAKQDAVNKKELDEYIKSVKAGQKQLADLSKEYERRAKAAEKAASDKAAKEALKQEAEEAKKLSLAIKELQNETKAYAAETQKELAAVKQKQNAYDILNATHRKLVKTAQEIGAAEGIESEAFKEAAAQANVLDAKLKAIDGQLGSHRRNVGNYTTQWNGLSYSVQQVVRELPSLSGGFTVFFSAIGNNIPMLKDQIDDLRRTNKALAAEGKATEPVWRSIGASLLSWNTAIVAILTILTVYGKDIIGFFTNAAKAAKEALIANLDLKDAVDDVVQSYQYLNKEVDRTEKLALARSKAKGDDIKEQTEIEKKAIQQRIDNLNRYTAQLIEQQGALERYLQRAPSTSNISEKDVKDATAQLNKIKDAYKKATEERIDLTNELTIKDYELQEQLRKKKEREDTKSDKKALSDRKLSADEIRRINIDMAKADAEFRQAEVKADMEHQKALIDNEKTSDDERMAARYQYHVDLIALAEIEKEKEDAINEEKHKATLADISRISDSAERERLTLLENERYRKQHYANIEVATEKSNAAITEYVDESQQDIQKSDDKTLKMRIANLNALTHANDDVAKRTSETWEQHINKILDKLKVLQAALTVFSEIGNLFKAIGERNIQNIDKEIEANDKKSQNEIANINATVADKTEAERQIREVEARTQAQREQLEARKKKIQQDQARFEKAASIASVIAKTAEAVVAALKIPIYGEALAVANAAIGAAQLATIIATPIPQYAKGTQGHPGGPAIVGEAYKPELVKEFGKQPYVVDTPTFLPNLGTGAQVIPLDHMPANAFVPYLKEYREIREHKQDFGQQIDRVVAASENIVRAINGKPVPRTILIGRDWSNYVNGKL